MANDWIEPIQSREYLLLREISAHLGQWIAKPRPLKAADMMTTISTDKLAEIMGWAQISLRGVVTEQTLAKQVLNLTAYPLRLDQPTPATDTPTRATQREE